MTNQNISDKELLSLNEGQFLRRVMARWDLDPKNWKVPAYKQFPLSLKKTRYHLDQCMTEDEGRQAHIGIEGWAKIAAMTGDGEIMRFIEQKFNYWIQHEEAGKSPETVPDKKQK